MIDRYVYVRLKQEYAGERRAMAEQARQVLSTIPGVLQVSTGTPADEHSDKAWDLGIALRFASLDEVEAYRVHPDHLRYVEEQLKPRMEVIKAWNFEVSAE